MITIRIVNKNNNTTYTAIEPAILTENYNEELDNARVTIDHLENQIEIEPFDRVILYDPRLGTYYMEVDTYECTQIGVNPKRYKYDITLFSETKELEGCLCPNLTITPSRTSTPKTIWNYLEEYNNRYGPKIKRGTTSSWNYFNKLSFATRVRTKFLNETCPELQWNNPTLREVFNSLMMIKDCIPVVKNGVIDYIDLTETKSNITENAKINYITRSQSSADYVSELQSTMTNVMQTNVKGVKNSVTTREVLTFQPDDDGWVVTDQNIVLKTTFPILNIKHLWIYMGRSYDSDNTSPYNADKSQYKRVDICDPVNSGVLYTYGLIKEYNEYKTLNIDFTIKTTEGLAYYTKKQNYNLFYRRYGNTISGFTNKSKLFLQFNTTWLEWFASQYGYLSEISNNIYFSYYFEIEYETIADMLYRASKSDKVSNDRVVVDNQDFSFVDAYSHGYLEQQKANRLGNKQMMLNARYDGSTNAEISQHIISIGDYYLENDNRKNIAYRVQYQVFTKHINVNAYLTKDYVLRNYFTGIKSRIRAWVNAREEAQQRHDISKVYCEFSFTQANDLYNPYSSNINFAYYMCSPLWSTDIQPIKFVAVRTENGSINYPAKVGNDYQWYILDCIARVVGNSLVVTFGFEDNYYVNKHPSKFDSNGNSTDLIADDLEVSNFGSPAAMSPLHIKNNIVSETGGIALSPYTYVSAEGNFTSISYMFLNDMEDINLVGTLDIDDAKDKVVNIFKLPLATESMLPSNARKIYNTISMLKDNKEIPYISTQIEFLSNTRDIVVGRKFVEYQEAVRTSNNPTLTIYEYDPTDTDFLQDTLPSGATSTNYSIVVTGTTNYYATIELRGTSAVSFEEGKYYYICDDNENVLIAYKCNTTSRNNVLYLNVLRQRNTNIYSNDGIISGTIEGD